MANESRIMLSNKVDGSPLELGEFKYGAPVDTLFVGRGVFPYGQNWEVDDTEDDDHTDVPEEESEVSE